MRIGIYIVLAASCLLTAAGCGGPSAAVQGTVTIDGQLAKAGTVSFHPDKGGPIAYGSIGSDGSFSLRVGQGKQNDPDAGDVPVGEYVATVVVNMPSVKDESVGPGGPPLPGARLSADKYADTKTSDLRRTVKAGRNVFPLELEGATAKETPAEKPAEAHAPSTPVEKPAPEVKPPAETAPAPETKPAPAAESKEAQAK